MAPDGANGPPVHLAPRQSNGARRAPFLTGFAQRHMRLPTLPLPFIALCTGRTVQGRGSSAGELVIVTVFAATAAAPSQSDQNPDPGTARSGGR